MTPKIVDASVAIKWFVPGEKGYDAALELLHEIELDPKPFCVPELFFNEMLAVLCKLTQSKAQLLESITLLYSLGFRHIGNGAELLSTAAAIAVDYHLSGYDSVYAACAKLSRGVWITADERAHKKIRALHISRCL